MSKAKGADPPQPIDEEKLQQTRAELKAKILCTEEIPAFNHAPYRKECHWDFVLKEVVSRLLWLVRVG